MRCTVGGAAVTAGFPTIIPASAIGAAGATPPGDRIALGCTGVGAMSFNDMGALLQHDNVRVVAVCDVQSRPDGSCQ
ncbi:MAG TPA: hypothetical protein PLA43_20160 [Bryobacteraceae bacterium]|nr:hypothetical protein [Bryobacteraceae bacterium]HOL72940.1 hypothetical protein [Bryobacteraceae bacterium]HOQ47235.1 hypothetical protein [Bryobacteraceae bacterium]HPQ14392.1 hypothetical protein [Bryobacteraceae bacterium]HPU74274.1 hypothetical protein [Bryobacteraceae bacterium]